LQYEALTAVYNAIVLARAGGVPYVAVYCSVLQCGVVC